MRKALLSLVGAAVGLSALSLSTGPAAAWGYRWYRDYAPLYPRAAYYYGPPVVYVVPPAYAYYPRPLYRYCPPGYIYGPAGTYYPRRIVYPRGVFYARPVYYGRRCCG